MSFLNKLKSPHNQNTPTINTATTATAAVHALNVVSKRVAGRSPFPRRGFSACSVQGNAKDIFILGGQPMDKSGASQDDVCHVSVLGTSGLTSFTNPLVTTGKPPSGRTELSCAAVDKKIFVFGGMGERVAFDDGFWVLNTETKAWSHPRVQGELPHQRRGHSAVSLGHRVVLFGGIAEEGVYLNEVVILDTQTLKCTLYPTSHGPCPRAYHSAAAYGSNKMVVFGGDSGYECLDDIWVLDLSGQQPSWSLMAQQQHAPDGRYQHAATLVGDVLYILGGNNCRGEAMDECLALDLISSTWTSVGKMPHPRSDFAICSLKDKIYVLGGVDGEEADAHSVGTMEIQRRRLPNAPVPVIVTALKSPASPPPTPPLRSVSPVECKPSTPKSSSVVGDSELKELRETNEQRAQEIKRLNAQVESTSRSLDDVLFKLKSAKQSSLFEMRAVKAEVAELQKAKSDLELSLKQEQMKISELTTQLEEEQKRAASQEMNSTVLVQKLETEERNSQLYASKMKENEALQGDIVKLQKEIASLKTNLETKQVQMSRQSETLSKTLASEKAEQTQFIARLQKATSDLEAKNAALTKELELIQIENRDLKLKNDVVAKDSAKLRQDSSTEKQRVDSELTSAKAALLEKEAELNRLIQENASLKQRVDTDDKHINGLVVSLEDKLSQSERERKELLVKLKETQEQNDQVLADFKVVRSAMEETQTQLANSRLHHDDWKTTEADWQQRVEQQNHRIAELESLLNETRQQLQASSQREAETQNRVFALTTALSKVANGTPSPTSPRSLEDGATASFHHEHAPCPPPPPPPMAGVHVNNSTPAPPPPPGPSLMANTAPALPEPAPARTNLLAEIQAGKKLKKVSPPSSTTGNETQGAAAKSPVSPFGGSDPMSKLLAEMANKKLKQQPSAQNAAKKPTTSQVHPELAKRLQSRQF